MTVIRWRPFWSYDVESTELWLANMAASGYELTTLNRWTRMFTFREVEHKKTAFHIVFDKTKGPLLHSLGSAGWKNKLATGNWMFLENDKETIHLHPIRDGILKRNQLHTTLLSAISIFYSIQFAIITMVFMVLFISGDIKNSIEPSPFWSITIIYFLQVIVVIGIAIYASRKLRKFERKFFHMDIDQTVLTGKTFSKWKVGWMDTPDTIENWLSEMAADGNHLVEMSNQIGRFIFQKGAPKQVSYVYDYQWKVSPTYFDVHKSAGWRLKFSTPFSFMRHSLWMKEYESGEEKPRFTYDQVEENVRVRKLLWGNLASNVIPIVFVLYFLTIIIPTYQANGWSLFERVLVTAVILSSLVPISRIVRIFIYSLRIKRIST